VERDQLPDEEAREGPPRRPARAEEALLGPDETDLDALRGQPRDAREVRRIAAGVGDDEIGGPQGVAVDRVQRPGGERARP
jgi:hypothetical protein